MNCLLFVCMLVPLALAAQSVAGPKSGFIFDNISHGLRPINGVPGSATLGDHVAGAQNVTAAAVCSSRQFALISSGDPTTSAVFQFAAGNTIKLPGDAFQAPSRIILSPSCSAGLLYSADSSQAQVITGLPNSPVLGATISLPLSDVSAFAISDDALSILAIAPGSGVYLITAGVEPALLVPLAGAGAVAFQNNQDALVADTQGNQILLLPNVVARSSPQTLAGPDQGISSPVSIAYDEEKQFVLFANSATAEIGLLNPMDSSIQLIGCGCQGSVLASVGRQLYEIADPVDGGPLLLLDFAASPPKVTFVPQR